MKKKITREMIEEETRRFLKRGKKVERIKTTMKSNHFATKSQYIYTHDLTKLFEVSP